MANRITPRTLLLRHTRAPVSAQVIRAGVDQLRTFLRWKVPAGQYLAYEKDKIEPNKSKMET